MKSQSIASLALVLALSGCSSSPSIEEETDSEEKIESQVKLLEYELCLRTQEEYWTNQLQEATPQLIEGLALQNCEDKRP